MKTPIEIMRARIQAALLDPRILEQARADFEHTFMQLGITAAEAIRMTDRVINLLQSTVDLEKTEREIFAWFGTMLVEGVPLTKVLDQKMSGRAEIIFNQVSPFFAGFDTETEIVDFGCGDGQVTQLLHDRLNLQKIVGYDVKLYKAAGVTVPINQIIGHSTAAKTGQFSAMLLTNVAHHEADNQKLLEEAARILRPGARLVVIETVPTENTKVAFEVNFLNDYFYNRLFHAADVPVPGTYELAANWVDRFRAVGFELEELHFEDISLNENPKHLGFDQPTIRDWHVLYVFKRK